MNQARTATSAPVAPNAISFGATLPTVRSAVRDLLLSTPAFQDLPPDRRRQLAEAMVTVCHSAAALIVEEIESDSAARAAPVARAASVERQPLATAQATGAGFTPGAAQQIGDVTRSVLNAVSFPRFVAELINGVFKAMIDSSMQQMNAYVDLLKNVAATVNGFADSQVGPAAARNWLAERYPESFEIIGDTEELEPGEERDPDEPPPQQTLRLKPGAAMPSPEAIKTDLGLNENESVPTGDPERTLVPFARRHLAKSRQGMLATMVMLGMQRIVVESGRITASMRFHVDTRSAAQEDKASKFDFRNQINASGSFGAGPWGVSASVSNTIGYVSTQRSQNTEEMNVDLDLNSSVEINFKSDYLPLNRMTTSGQADRIRENSLNPEAEAIKARTDRAKLASDSDKARRDALNSDLRTGQGQAGQGQAGQGQVGQGGQAGQGQAGQGRAGQGQAGQGVASENTRNVSVRQAA